MEQDGARVSNRSGACRGSLGRVQLNFPPRATVTSGVAVLLMFFLAFLPSGRAAWADGSAHGAWFAQFDGYGTTSVVSDPLLGTALQLRPASSRTAGETHAALATTRADYGDFDLNVRVRTIAQLRPGAPNTWEMG